MQGNIKIALVGVGNCACSLIQGIHYYRKRPDSDTTGLMHPEIGGYAPDDIKVVVAFDVDARKVGQDIHRAIFAPPNCTQVFCSDIPDLGIQVRMGNILDGVAEHMSAYPPERSFVLADEVQPDAATVVAQLKESGAEILVNYLPVGSEDAVRFYAQCALDAGLAFVNNMPVFIASDAQWEARFAEAGLPLIGDDIKSQLGATITHRMLVDLFKKRGVKIDRTYQLNTGGNTDFLNMLSRHRLASKKISKTEAVQSVSATRIKDENIHIGPSDYVPWQKDNKICFLRLEGRLFGNVPMNLELRLSVEDSPNSAGVAIDSIRCAKLALERGLCGVLDAPSAYFCKHPPRQVSDDEAYQMMEDFIREEQS
ncbi:MAG: inositol-3-phosphate synthase [Mariprofundaceae bacterium]